MTGRDIRALCVLTCLLGLSGCSLLKPPAKVESFFPRNKEVETKGAEKARKVVVFVHGIVGDSRGTWTSNGNSWFELIKNDRDFDQFDIYSIGYDSPAIGSSSDIEEIANRVMQIEIANLLARKYEEIYFITHSMGGLITKRALFKLKNAPESTANGIRKVGVVFFISTPAAGAELADWTSWLSDNPQLKNMQTHDGATFLNSIGADWRQLLRARPSSRTIPKSFCGYETKPVGPILVVPRIYSEMACDEEPVAFDETHMSIVPPTSTGDLVYRWTKTGILDLTDRFDALDIPWDKFWARAERLRGDYFESLDNSEIHETVRKSGLSLAQDVEPQTNGKLYRTESFYRAYLIGMGYLYSALGSHAMGPNPSIYGDLASKGRRWLEEASKRLAEIQAGIDKSLAAGTSDTRGFQEFRKWANDNNADDELRYALGLSLLLRQRAGDPVRPQIAENFGKIPDGFLRRESPRKEPVVKWYCEQANSVKELCARHL